ncbi:M23 family metallopeptidase [Leucobacter sp. NPDC058333]|uniref:M23 family metallopeptidase n=1 Tax=Leucobacter sp. NPDC058333 TaxID=3346450 RepID=UPI00365A7606
MTPRLTQLTSLFSILRLAATVFTAVPLVAIPPAAISATSGSAAAAIPQTVTAKTASIARWVPPVAVPFEVIEPFRAPEHAYGPGHRGVDLAARAGTEVRAPVGGTVTFAGTVVDRPVISVRVDETTVYSMEPVSSMLSAGDTVNIGAPIGTLSGAGHCGGRCVHLGVRVSDEYVNPLRYFFTRPVLLPW